jgi:hypothetical protein
MASLANSSLFLLLFVLLIAPCPGSSTTSYTTRTHGGRHFVHRSSSGARRPSQTMTYCSTVPYGNSMIPNCTRNILLISLFKINLLFPMHRT